MKIIALASACLIGCASLGFAAEEANDGKAPGTSGSTTRSHVTPDDRSGKNPGVLSSGRGVGAGDSNNSSSEDPAPSPGTGLSKEGERKDPEDPKPAEGAKEGNHTGPR